MVFSVVGVRFCDCVCDIFCVVVKLLVDFDFCSLVSFVVLFFFVSFVVCLVMIFWCMMFLIVLSVGMVVGL